MGKNAKFKRMRKIASQMPEVNDLDHYQNLKRIYKDLKLEGVRRYINAVYRAQGQKEDE